MGWLDQWVNKLPFFSSNKSAAIWEHRTVMIVARASCDWKCNHWFDYSLTMAWVQCKSKTSKSLTHRCCFKSAFGLTAKNSIGRIFCLASLFIKVIGRDPRYHDQYFMKSKFKHHRWLLCPKNWLGQSDMEDSCLPTTFLHVCQNWILILDHTRLGTKPPDRDKKNMWFFVAGVFVN